MLNSFEIAHALIDFGFELDNDNTHGWGFLGQENNERIYVKTSKKKFENVVWETDHPVKTQPLVLPKELQLTPSLLKLLQKADYEVNTSYKNHNLTWLLSVYPEEGIALNVSSKASLKELLQELGYLSSDSDVLQEIKQQEFTLPNDPTEREAVRKARIGQGIFRKSLEKLWNGTCCITGFQNRALLRASHIKPWSHCSNIERLDPENGLLLIANIDAAFDSGFVSFQDTGVILISEGFSDDTGATGIHSAMKLSKALTKTQKQYLEYHRHNIFRN
jgi:putative restriction endonuclease